MGRVSLKNFTLVVHPTISLVHFLIPCSLSYVLRFL